VNTNILLVGLIGLVLSVLTFFAGVLHGKKGYQHSASEETKFIKETAKTLKEDDVTQLRQRVEYEDDLLNTRTNIVLTLNGLMAIAASMSLPSTAQLVGSLVIIIVDILWIVCAFDSRHFIHSLTASINESSYVPIDEKLRKVFKSRLRIGSTQFMSVVIPTLLVVGWVLSLAIVALK